MTANIQLEPAIEPLSPEELAIFAQMQDPGQWWVNYDSRLQECWAAIVEHGLERNVAELDALGYTLLNVGADPAIVAGMHETVFATAERQWGPGARDGSAGVVNPAEIDITPVLRFNDLAAEPAFVAAVTNPRAVALARYVCGANVRVASIDAFYKTKGQSTKLHCDSEFPDPLPEWDYLCNAAWYLTDVTCPEDGALSFVPGSHRFRRRPGMSDDTFAAQRAVPVLGKAGTVVFFRGSTWHGTPPKSTPGVRAHAAIFYQRELNVRSARIPVPQHLIDATPSDLRSVIVAPRSLAELHDEKRMDANGMGSDFIDGTDNPEMMRVVLEEIKRKRGGGSQYI